MCKSKISYKSYSLIFIDNVRLMNNFLYSLVDNLTCNLYNTSCKNCIACVDCKTGKNCVIKERCSVL